MTFGRMTAQRARRQGLGGLNVRGRAARLAWAVPVRTDVGSHQRNRHHISGGNDIRVGCSGKEYGPVGGHGAEHARRLGGSRQSPDGSRSAKLPARAEQTTKRPSTNEDSAAAVRAATTPTSIIWNATA